MSQKTKQITIRMTQGEHARAMQLVDLIGARSLSDVMRHSLQLYDVAYQAKRDGCVLGIVNTETGQAGQVLVAGLAGVGRSDDQ